MKISHNLKLKYLTRTVPLVLSNAIILVLLHYVMLGYKAHQLGLKRVVMLKFRDTTEGKM